MIARPSPRSVERLRVDALEAQCVELVERLEEGGRSLAQIATPREHAHRSVTVERPSQPERTRRGALGRRHLGRVDDAQRRPRRVVDRQLARRRGRSRRRPPRERPDRLLDLLGRQRARPQQRRRGLERDDRGLDPVVRRPAVENQIPARPRAPAPRARLASGSGLRTRWRSGPPAARRRRAAMRAPLGATACAPPRSKDRRSRGREPAAASAERASADRARSARSGSRQCVARGPRPARGPHGRRRGRSGGRTRGAA